MDQNHSDLKDKIKNPSEETLHDEKKGLEEPVTQQKPKLQLGIIIFALTILILVILAWSFNFLDLFS